MLGPVIPDAATAPKLATIARAAFMDGGRGWAPTDFIAFGAAPGAVVIADGAIAAGAILFRVTGEEGEIVDFGVVPTKRAQGIGRRLLSSAHHGAWALGARRMVLEVAEDNAPARALYDAFGYTAVGRRPRYYRRADGARVDALILAHDLSPPACPP